MNRKNLAFTLIELLVVIAIIAILAAILFPVFAQAKVSAKKAGSISNVKQLNLAEQMYAGDYDDTMVRVGNWNSGDPDSWGGYASWALMLDPYQKDVDMNWTPLSSSPLQSGDIKHRIGTRLLTYGFNYTYLSPSPTPNWPAPIQSVSATAVAQPSSTIMFAERMNPLYGNPARSTYWYGANTAWMIIGTIETPYCEMEPDYWCTDGWGIDSWYATFYAVGASADEGRYTGGVAFRAAHMNPVGMCDGSVKPMSAGAMAAGTNWNVNSTSSSIIVNDATKYLWDTKQ
jgi:prepilin-type N-terminal cleavage/methylation domain-containing protein